jgi:NADH-quinone oxidoreductase subunit G
MDGSSALAVACAELMKNRVGEPNNGLIGVWPRANDQGAWEMGFKPEPNLARALKDKNVYVVAADPAGDDPALAAALKEAKFVIAQELFLTKTAELADVVLPAQAYTERDGSFTSGERRVQRFYPVVQSRGQTKADFAITAEIGKELGLELEGRSALLVMDKMAAALPAFAGVSYRRLAEVSEQWPVVGRGDLYYGGTAYENKQGLGRTLDLIPGPSTTLRLRSLTWPPGQVGQTGRGEPKPLRPDEGRWLALPVTRLYDLGITVAASELLKARIGEACIILPPEASKKLGVEAGGQVEINGRRLEVRLDATIPAGVALIPRSMGVPITGPVIVKLKKA